MDAVDRPKRRPPLQPTPEVYYGIIAILSNPKTGPGTRAAYLCRKYSRYLGISARARLLYVLLSGFIGADGRSNGRITVPMKKLAEWLDCTPRVAQSAVRELVRSGPLPLMTSNPGRPGRASEYGFVSNPFALAEQQAEDAQRTRERRQRRTSAERNAVMIAHHVKGTLDADAARRELSAIAKRHEWNLPTRVPLSSRPAKPASSLERGR